MGKDNQEDIFDILSREGALEEALTQPESRPDEEPAGTQDLDAQGWIRAKELGISYIRISSDQVDPSLIKILPEDLERKNIVVPYLRIGNDLTVIMANPENLEVIQDIKKISGCEVETALGEKEEILSALDLAYGRLEVPAPPAGKEAAPPLTSELFARKEITRIQEDPSGEVLLDLLLKKVIERNASRVFIRHLGAETVISVRARGLLDHLGTIDRSWGATLETRIAILSATVGRKNQVSLTGAFYRKVEENDYLVHVYLHSLARGREITLAIFDPDRPVPDLEEFNLDSKDRSRLEALAGRKEGLLIVSGGRGGGSLEAAYAFLNLIDPEKRRVVTIEPRTERIIPAYSQVETSFRNDRPPEDIIETVAGLDPDVVFVSDCIDPEMQVAAFQSAAEGRLVIGGLPCSRPAQALALLSALPESEDLLPIIFAGILVVNQIRVLCPKCRVPDPEAPAGGKGPAKDSRRYKPGKCPECNHTGYRGFQYVSEFIPASVPLTGLLRKQASESQWEKFLSQKGLLKSHRVIRQELKAGAITREEAALHGVSGSTAKG